MSLHLRGAVLATVALLASVPATAQGSAVPEIHRASLVAAPPPLSADCKSNRLPGDRFRRPLRNLSRAVHEKRPVRILAIGSSSTAGVGASSPSATYVAKLETVLDGTFKGLDFQVIGRGLSGEEAQGAADRMKKEVEQNRPDVVVWQVGTNDAIRHVGIDRLKECLKNALAWLRQQKTDVVLIDPQYGEALTKDQHYEKVVAAIAEVARDARVLLVDRFDAMRELQRARGDKFYLTSDNLHLNDTGHRCMAEQLARSIVGGLLMADSEAEQPVFYP